jgi:hypothetical protein
MPKPVVVGLSGGLGNQMFQYAAGRSLALRLNTTLVLDLSWFEGQAERKFALAPFCIDSVQSLPNSWLPAYGRALLSRLSRRWFTRIMDVPVYREPHFHYSSDFKSISAPVFLEGYWQSESYFREIRPLLLRDFTLKQPLPEACVNVLQVMNEYDAICVHVRRGDYFSNPKAAKIHGSCSENYYRNGVRELCQDLANPCCFVFSDDSDWVRTSLSFDCPMIVVDINGPNEAHLDVVLMAACHYFLIANSSLSWWGAWLAPHTEKKIIAPKRWFLTSDKSTHDLLPESWECR